jgi:hypothetical protein
MPGVVSRCDVVTAAGVPPLSPHFTKLSSSDVELPRTISARVSDFFASIHKETGWPTETILAVLSSQVRVASV